MPITEIGAKAGEKLYEELMSDEETRRTVELTEMFAVMPAFRNVYEDIAYDYADIVNTNVTDPYVSSPGNSMSLEDLGDFCLNHDLLAPYMRTTIPVSAARPSRRAA